MALKVTNSQIWKGSISKKKCHHEYYLCENFMFVLKTTQGWYYATLLNQVGGSQSHYTITVWDIDKMLYQHF